MVSDEKSRFFNKAGPIWPKETAVLCNMVIIVIQWGVHNFTSLSFLPFQNDIFAVIGPLICRPREVIKQHYLIAATWLLTVIFIETLRCRNFAIKCIAIILGSLLIWLRQLLAALLLIIDKGWNNQNDWVKTFLFLTSLYMKYHCPLCQISMISVVKICSIIPTLELPPLLTAVSKGGNSNTGKIDQTWAHYTFDATDRVGNSII